MLTISLYIAYFKKRKLAKISRACQLSLYRLALYLDFQGSKLYKIIITPKYKKNINNSEVRRASQTHQVPHIGLPQIDPVTKAIKVNTAPNFAEHLVAIFVNLIFQTKLISILTAPKEGRPYDRPLVFKENSSILINLCRVRKLKIVINI